MTNNDVQDYEDDTDDNYEYAEHDGYADTEESDAEDAPGGSWEPEQRQRAARPKRPQPHRPANVRQPQDHRRPKPKRSPARREAEGDLLAEVHYEGMTFTFPADQDDWPTTAMQAFNNARHIDGVQHLLGPQQWAEFITKCPKFRQVKELGDLISREVGLGTAGN